MSVTIADFDRSIEYYENITPKTPEQYEAAHDAIAVLKEAKKRAEEHDDEITVLKAERATKRSGKAYARLEERWKVRAKEELEAATDNAFVCGVAFAARAACPHCEDDRPKLDAYKEYTHDGYTCHASDIWKDFYDGRPKDSS